MDLPELKQRIEALPTNNGGRRQYTAAVKKAVLEYVEKHREAGGTLERACEDVGINKGTVLGWRPGARKSKKKQMRRAPKVQPVEIVASRQQPAVVLPGGARIEGLSIQQLAQLVKALA